MAEINVVDQSNNVVHTRVLKDEVFAVDADASLVHRVYSALALAQRAGTRGVKTRAAVSGGGKKPFKQKGTGRARQGSTRATQMRHGGIAHGPKAVEYTTRINRKERQKAMRILLSEAVRNNKLIVVDKLELAEIKTKNFIEIASALSANSALYVLGEKNSQVELSARNIPHTKVVLDRQMNMHDVMKHDFVVLTEAALDKIEGSLS
ncbi:MAG: 50S ribosomal protein L4 [Zetaproteobacteria bacterium CG_4_9_14_3_um_filter_49_83]|nr:MAG: 50S ribosomal protein L4 [Zetaproteobacteria bacterium CG1_02_49_23]PIQ32714.1 MAG: 50S ribosomal protein L4 [Zetaproteobacteria bacterium CG17_big_fil_post_rev_8_21_14_2_50_50_13]PIV29946.1 MAG: 50S ribosomal protein L4 [Zetaproteobacteria bacterium CG02_land_8_20_14_3_00_50_9]PIY55319.1 MAG: 50S ribosomal protein L4 [Zetaproteobacteria bacterium CG_4_10_14_0_8_um_filter_49_80]PJA36131.1 MAG: 50S ribosomal protein L4 [Zetaproteobacteria bacterium CG_4_9_14_3_um_filter_49_83]